MRLDAVAAWSMVHVGARKSAGASPELLPTCVETRRLVWILGPQIELVDIGQALQEVARADRTGLPGTNFPDFRNRTEIEIPDVLSNICSGVVNVSSIDSVDVLFAWCLS